MSVPSASVKLLSSENNQQMGKWSGVFNVIYVVRRLGLRRVFLYGLHRIKLRSGWYLKVSPTVAWASARPHYVQTGRSPFSKPDLSTLVPTNEVNAAIIKSAERVLVGEFCYFSYDWRPRPLDWKTNPINGHRVPDVHWSAIHDFGPEQGDIKWVWEPSRFDWVYQLGRAWVIANDARFANEFWSLLYDWRKNNPPNLGINWKCGQECSFRLFALIWASGIFASANCSTQQHQEVLWETVEKLAQRIEASIDYALSQNNNHGLSEAAALYVTGVCMPTHPRSSGWRKLGLSLFLKQMEEQFANDGTYVQNSFNYTRLAMRVCVTVMAVARSTGDVFPDHVRERLLQSVTLLYQAQDESTGFVPNYGANDGANIQNMSGADYLDFRPIVQTLGFLLTGKRFYSKIGRYDEDILWYGATTAVLATGFEVERGNYATPTGGYYVIRNGLSYGMLRCHTHRTRPGHADMLHLDLWWNGENLALDAGTYQYFDDNDWGDYLKSTLAHNTVSVDQSSQMRKWGKFLWLDWTVAKALQFDFEDGTTCWSGEHYGYRKFGIVHRRTVYARESEWVIIDDLIREKVGVNRIDLYWHLVETGDWVVSDRCLYSPSRQVWLQCFSSGDAAFGVCRGETGLPANGQSLHYGQISPTMLAKLTSSSDSSLRFVTAITQNPIAAQAGKLIWKQMEINLSIQ